MKTRFIAISAVCALALAAACEKQIQTVPTAQESKIVAFVDNSDSKTSYANESTFSWEKSDRIYLVVTNKESGKADHYSHYADEAGTRVSFTGSAIGDAWEAAGYALYPALTHGGTSTDGLTVTLPAEYTLSGSNFMSIIPLIGTPVDDDPALYRFRTAVGILKVSFSNVPLTARQLVLTTSDNIAGEFPLNDLASETGIQMSEAVSGTGSITLNFPAQANGSDLTLYIPVPVGTISAGATLSVLNSAGEVIKTTNPTTKAINVVRNQLLNITPTPIALEAANIDLSPLLGEYGMIVYSTGPYSGGYGEPGDIVLEESDDQSKGNVMMTKFGGVSGKQYGTFDGTYLVFPKDQIFGDNPFSDADTKPYVALDFYQNGVVDATFELLETGKIKAVNADVFGLRSCTEEDWQTYGGGWPWVLSYSSLTAQWKSLIVEEQTVYEKGKQIKLTESMIQASDVCSHDGQGVSGMIDDDADTYWHSNWYYAVQNNDSLYGIYFDITLEEAIDALQFKYQVRSGNRNGRPTHIVIGISQDGTSWTKIADLVAGDGEGTPSAMQNAAAGDWVELPAYDITASKYIRFGIADSADPSYPDYDLTTDLSADGYKKSTNLAELQLWWAE